MGIYITIVYERDGRTVEGPVEHLHKFIERQEPELRARPVPSSVAVYQAWRRSEGLGLWKRREALEDSLVEVEAEAESRETPGEEPGPAYREEGGEEPEPEAEPAWADLDSMTEPPPGYALQSRPPWYTAFDSEGRKVGRAQKTPEAALEVAWNNFREKLQGRD